MTAQEFYQIVSQVCGVDISEIYSESDFWEDFNCEPAQIQELREIIEDHIGEKFENSDYNSVKTVNDLITLIEEYSNEFIG